MTTHLSCPSQIGSKSVSGLSREEFSELFEDVVSGGTSVKIIPQVDSKEVGHQSTITHSHYPHTTEQASSSYA